MKTVLTSGYAFTAATKTLDFTGSTGFDVRRLLAVLNLTRGALVYAVGTAGLGFSTLAGGNVLTLAFDTTAHANGDALMVLYDATSTAAQDSSLQSILTALGTLGTHADETTLLAKLEAVRLLLANPALASGAATDATLQQIKAALLAQIDFSTLFVTDGTSYYVRRESVNEGTSATTVTFETMSGAVASPVVANLTPIIPGASGGASGGTTRTIETTFFDAAANGTGITAGDVLARVLVFDVVSGGIVASYWHNMMTGAAVTPAVGSYVEQSKGLPIGAAKDATVAAITTALQAGLGVTPAATESHLGSVGSDSKRIVAVPALTAGTTYASGKCVGGLMTLSGVLRAAGKSATAQSASLHAKVALSAPVDLVIFRDTPTVLTGLADNATFAVDPADFDKVSKVLSFTGWTSLGTPSLARLDGIGALLSAASGVDLKAILVARGSVAISTASDLSVGLGIYQD
ncbi:hypothetical protein [Methylobacterium sp. GC_Met_2]|uniref:hypothetical protein n=1 Tax=Methylobacterium sp. GC_Met_2 TaxID=2937376 RepID=UPI00226B4E5D|nr:hypothetical protein [Methylobacterium sp. GC_Met_2]